MRQLSIIFFLSILVISCSKEKGSADQNIDDIGKYVFFDDAGVLHLDERCYKLRFGNDEDGHKIYAKEIVDTVDLVRFDRVCSNCVSSRFFEHLNEISIRNEKRDKSRKWLFEKFKAANYDMGEYREFVRALEDPVNRRNLYDAACDEGWDVGTFYEFTSRIGYKTAKSQFKIN